MQPDRLMSLEREAEAIGSADELARVCSHIGRECDLPYYCFGLRLPTSFVDAILLLVDGYPEAFRQRYIAKDGLNVDPILARAHEQTSPIYWDEVFATVKPRSKAGEWVAMVRGMGLRSGISFPYRGGRGQFGLYSVATSADDPGTRARLRYLAPVLFVAGSMLHDAATRLTTEDPARVLTAREQECLIWCAEGKTARETGELLRIAERTVTFHLNNVAAKLGVNGRQHAVARAVAMGVIEPRVVSLPLD